MLQIVLAEDNPGDILLVREALQVHHVDHELHVLRDGGEALIFVARMGQEGGTPCPDIMLLDMNLPKVDGPDVLAEFRKHPACTRTPVIVITSSDTQRDRDRMAGLGITAYFRKPSNLDAFMQLGAMVRDAVKEQDS